MNKPLFPQAHPEDLYLGRISKHDRPVARDADVWLRVSPVEQFVVCDGLEPDDIAVQPLIHTDRNEQVLSVAEERICTLRLAQRHWDLIRVVEGALNAYNEKVRA